MPHDFRIFNPTDLTQLKAELKKTERVCNTFNKKFSRANLSNKKDSNLYNVTSYFNTMLSMKDSVNCEQIILAAIEELPKKRLIELNSKLFRHLETLKKKLDEAETKFSKETDFRAPLPNGAVEIDNSKIPNSRLRR